MSRIAGSLSRQELRRLRCGDCSRSRPLQRHAPGQGANQRSRSLPDAQPQRQSGVSAEQMKLNHGQHHAYCTNVQRGENWAETFESVKQYALADRKRVCPDKPYAIGLRLSNQASVELSDAKTLSDFRRWLDKNDCYVFTINGFPFGRFHGARVKEQVYLPDWTSPERLAYTNRLFDLLAQLLPQDVEGSVSTLPGSFKEFVTSREQEKTIRDNLWRCVEHVAKLSEQTGRDLHLGLEPEPLGWLENSAETIHFFGQMRKEHPNDARLGK